MSKYAIQIEDERKAKSFVSFLNTLDFVRVTTLKSEKPTLTNSKAFFSMKGLWKKRKVTGKELRQAAWNRDSR